MPRVGTFKITKEVLFDTIFLPENVQGSQPTAVAFSIPMYSYAGRCLKTERDTNLQQASMLSAPDSFSVQGAGIAIRDSYGWIDTVNRWWDGKVSFQLLCKEYLAGSLRDFADENLLSAIRNAPVDIDPSAIEDTNNGIVMISPQAYFSCRVIFDHRVNVPMDLVIGIYGYRVTVIDEHEVEASSH